MKRNWDTIRELLIKIEECTLPTENVRLDQFPEERAAEISYHVRLLIDAGLINGRISETLGSEVKDFFASSLTWHGYELLDTIRSNQVWEKTKSTFLEKGIEMTFDLVKSGATQIAAAILKAAIT